MSRSVLIKPRSGDNLSARGVRDCCSTSRLRKTESPPSRRRGGRDLKKDAAKPPLNRSGRGGCFKPPLIHSERFVQSVALNNHPVCAFKERDHFLYGAATPPSRRRGIIVSPRGRQQPFSQRQAECRFGCPASGKHGVKLPWT